MPERFCAAKISSKSSWNIWVLYSLVVTVVESFQGSLRVMVRVLSFTVTVSTCWCSMRERTSA